MPLTLALDQWSVSAKFKPCRLHWTVCTTTQPLSPHRAGANCCDHQTIVLCCAVLHTPICACQRRIPCTIETPNTGSKPRSATLQPYTDSLSTQTGVLGVCCCRFIFGCFGLVLDLQACWTCALHRVAASQDSSALFSALASMSSPLTDSLPVSLTSKPAMSSSSFACLAVSSSCSCSLLDSLVAASINSLISSTAASAARFSSSCCAFRRSCRQDASAGAHPERKHRWVAVGVVGGFQPLLQSTECIHVEKGQELQGSWCAVCLQRPKNLVQRMQYTGSWSRQYALHSKLSWKGQRSQLSLHEPAQAPTRPPLGPTVIKQHAQWATAGT